MILKFCIKRHTSWREHRATAAHRRLTTMRGKWKVLPKRGTWIRRQRRWTPFCSRLSGYWRLRAMESLPPATTRYTDLPQELNPPLKREQVYVAMHMASGEDRLPDYHVISKPVELPPSG